MIAVDQVRLDRRIAEERMNTVEPGEEPAWTSYLDPPGRVWTMDAQGEVSRDWQWSDSVDWRDVYAVRVENAWGQGVDVDELDDDDDCW